MGLFEDDELLEELMDEIEGLVREKGHHLIGYVICEECGGEGVSIVPPERGFEHIECRHCHRMTADLMSETS